MIKIWYLDNNGDWQSTDNSTAMKLEEMLQRLQSWRGEKSFDSLDGVDYLAVMNRQAFLMPQLEDIAEQYSQYFQSVTFENVTASESEIVINVKVVLLSGSAVARTILITP